MAEKIFVNIKCNFKSGHLHFDDDRKNDIFNSLWPSQNKIMFGFDNPETDCWHPHYYLMSGGQLTKLMCQLSRPQYILNTKTS